MDARRHFLPTTSRALATLGILAAALAISAGDTQARVQPTDGPKTKAQIQAANDDATPAPAVPPAARPLKFIADTSRNEPAAWRTIRMKVTGYCACKKCCGPNAKGITASGKTVYANASRFAAADRSLPFGTRLVVPGYNGGQAVPVLDRGGAIKGQRLDLYFKTHQQARNWGVRYLDVKVQR